jgi:NADH dehydrogenase [ubiquinone] 1 alpha subcomplex assembly factor 1
VNRIITHFFLSIMAILFCNFGAMAKEVNKKINKDEHVIYSFEKADEIESWRIINDGVMGGLSQSNIISSDFGTAIFKGTVSLENYGGFASTRTVPVSYDLGEYEGIRIRVKGDGKKYQFRLRTDDSFDGISYRYEFTTEAGTWTIIDIPFNECKPVFRGRILKDVEAIIPEEIKQLGFLISDKQSGEFQIEIDWIKAYRK